MTNGSTSKEDDKKKKKSRFNEHKKGSYIFYKTIVWKDKMEKTTYNKNVIKNKLIFTQCLLQLTSYKTQLSILSNEN